ncbi:MAG: amidohydrolase family protein, partial [Hyphomicrobiales bacterium]|nr:amidohydrolase family protein [Hyphomicrobiales bacterium]
MNASHVMHAYRALLPSGWASNVNFTISDGLFQKIDVDATPTGNAVRVGTVIAGVANLHSHAFQRSLAGMSERRDGSADTFMSWRSAMYSALDRLTPDLFEDICTYVYARMVLFGYTNVAEFHYVHRDKKGVLYDNPAELSIRTVRAARNAGIGITHLPVIYRYGGFNRQALSPQQARMECAPEMAFTIAESVKSAFKSDVAVSVGLAPHSLRAVDHSGMDQIAK